MRRNSTSLSRKPSPLCSIFLVTLHERTLPTYFDDARSRVNLPSVTVVPGSKVPLALNNAPQNSNARGGGGIKRRNNRFPLPVQNKTKGRGAVCSRSQWFPLPMRKKARGRSEENSRRQRCSRAVRNKTRGRGEGNSRSQRFCRTVRNKTRGAGEERSRSRRFPLVVRNKTRGRGEGNSRSQRFPRAVRKGEAVSAVVAASAPPRMRACPAPREQMTPPRYVTFRGSHI